jgi:hypothetical protein
MKTQIKYLLFIALSFGITQTHAQIKPQKGIKNSKLKPRTVTINKNIDIIKRVDIQRLESAKERISPPQVLNVDPKLLKVRSKRTWKVSPKNPYDSGLSFGFYGNFSIDGFTVKPRLSGNTVNNYSPNDYYSYSGFISFNARSGKEYRLKINLIEFSGKGKIEVNDQISEVSQTKKTINYVFAPESSGLYVIALSPYQRHGAINPSDFTISTIEVDQISD